MIERVAYLSMHTSPLLQPGTGDAGGMNVYLHELARTMALRGIEVDVFTRRCDADRPEVVEVLPGYRVIHVDAGPEEVLPVANLAPHVAAFAEGVIKCSHASRARYDLVHSHYWLSGWAGVVVKEALDIPLANSFHTLGRIKDLTRREGEAAASPIRLLTEQGVIARSSCVIASTPAEARDLLEHYQASPERLCVTPPGIDHAVFRPGNKEASRSWLGLPPGPLVLFVGRVQPLKGLDVVLEAVDLMRPEFPDVTMVAVGGPSGPGGREEYDRIRALVERRDMGSNVHLLAPQPHAQLADFYRAADVLMMPSRSESFGLVAAEAQASGLPVVATKVGGLPYIVDDGVTGALVDGWDPADHAAAATPYLRDPALAAATSAAAAERALRFSWPVTADRLLELYEGITTG